MSDDFLAVLHHEVRSPTAALAAVAAAARRPELGPAERERLLELAVAAARNLERLLEDATPSALRPEPLDAAALAEEVAALARLAGARVLALPTDGVPVVADRDRLRQALANLVDNAVAHAPAGTDVTVTAASDGAWARLSVSDTGEGIAPGDAARVFERGARLAHDRPGSGIGLAVVKEVAEAHGGRVELRSAPGQGATFTLVLPCAGPASV